MPQNSVFPEGLKQGSSHKHSRAKQTAHCSGAEWDSIQCVCVTACWRCLLCNSMSLWFGTCDRETRPRTMPLPLLSTSKLPLQVLHQNAYFCKSPVHRESKQMHRMIYKHPWVVTLKPGQLEVPSREQSWSNDPSSEAYPCGSVPVHLAVLCIWAHVIDQNKSLKSKTWSHWWFYLLREA